MCDGHTFAIYMTDGYTLAKKQKFRNFGGSERATKSEYNRWRPPKKLIFIIGTFRWEVIILNSFYLFFYYVYVLTNFMLL